MREINRRIERNEGNKKTEKDTKTQRHRKRDQDKERNCGTQEKKKGVSFLCVAFFFFCTQ